MRPGLSRTWMLVPALAGSTPAFASANGSPAGMQSEAGSGQALLPYAASNQPKPHAAVAKPTRASRVPVPATTEHSTIRNREMEMAVALSALPFVR